MTAPPTGRHAAIDADDTAPLAKVVPLQQPPVAQQWPYANTPQLEVQVATADPWWRRMYNVVAGRGGRHRTARSA